VRTVPIKDDPFAEKRGSSLPKPVKLVLTLIVIAVVGFLAFNFVADQGRAVSTSPDGAWAVDHDGSSVFMRHSGPHFLRGEQLIGLTAGQVKGTEWIDSHHLYIRLSSDAKYDEAGTTHALHEVQISIERS